MIRNSMLLLLFFITACGNKFDSKEELQAFITDEENHFRQQKSVNGIDYVFQYRPTDLVVHQEAAGVTSSKRIDSLRKKYSKYVYFNLSLSRNNQEVVDAEARDKTKFAQMVNQLSFEMGNLVHLVTKNSDTIKLVDFIYPRMYGMASASTIMFVYRREDVVKESTLNFIIEDIGLDTGDVKFKIETNLLKPEPQLNF